MTTITVKDVDVSLLREQRDWLLTLPENEESTGLVNLLDHMLDVADGYAEGGEA